MAKRRAIEGKTTSEIINIFHRCRVEFSFTCLFVLLEKRIIQNLQLKKKYLYRIPKNIEKYDVQDFYTLNPHYNFYGMVRRQLK